MSCVRGRPTNTIIAWTGSTAGPSSPTPSRQFDAEPCAPWIDTSLHDDLHFSAPADAERGHSGCYGPLSRTPHLLRRAQLRGSRARDGERSDARGAVLLHQAG